MGNYIEYDDKMAFHPGYYIKEIVEESGLTQEDFAKKARHYSEESEPFDSWRAESFY